MADLKPSTKLYFSHGIEIENHLIVKSSSEVLVGDELLTIWDQMLLNAFEFLKKLPKNSPKEYTQKIKKIEISEVEKHERKLKFIFVHYKLGKKTIPVNVFGPDPNISQITWLLELVTPPCEYLEELQWWIETLYASALNGLKKTDIALLPIGLNPGEERFRSGLSCGSHHHMGIPDTKERIAVYNMFRNFVPHLIALSSTSPFINKSTKGNAKIRDLNGRKQVIGRYTHSNRLANNTGQIGPNIPDYLPFLKSTDSKKDFSNYVRKLPPDDRMVDIYPFTDYDTIELRFFDAQPFYENRLAIVVLLQALAAKASSMAKSKQEIPGVHSAILFENRGKSVELGLLAQFSIDSSLTGDFGNFYNFDVSSGKRASKLIQSTKSLISYVKEELESFNRPDILNYIILPILGSETFEPPFSINEYLISQYFSLNNDLKQLTSKLFYSDKLTYDIVSKGDLSEFSISTEAQLKEENGFSSTLGAHLQKDLQTRKKTSSRPTTKSRERKSLKTQNDKKSKKPSKKAPKKQKAKVEVEPPSKPVEETDIETEEHEIFEEPKKKESKKETIISAFDVIEEEDIYSPAIEIEPKYTKIKSKIAEVMRKRREDLEKKKKELYKEHLIAERTKISPEPKKVKLEFPTSIAGKKVFGYVKIEWHKDTVYKLTNNTIHFYLKATNKSTQTSANLKTYSTPINTRKALETGKSNIPILFSLEQQTGEIDIEINGVTATNEEVFRDIISLTRNDDEIQVRPLEFYINGDYGPVECIFQAQNLNSELKANLEMYLAVQEHSDPIQLSDTKIKVQEKEIFSFFSFVDLDPIYHNAPFFIVIQLVTGRVNKNYLFEAIRVKPTTECIVDWQFDIPEDKPDINEGVLPKTKYELNFLLHFYKKLPPTTISIYVNTLPEGKTKKLASSEIKREIDAGDEILIEGVKFKTPKNIGYLYFDVEARTKEGFIPSDLISSPIGISLQQDD